MTPKVRPRDFFMLVHRFLRWGHGKSWEEECVQTVNEWEFFLCMCIYLGESLQLLSESKGLLIYFEKRNQGHGR